MTDGLDETELYEKYLKHQIHVRILVTELKKRIEQISFSAQSFFTLEVLVDTYLSLSEQGVKQLRYFWHAPSFNVLFRTLFESFLMVRYAFYLDGISLELKMESYRYCEAKDYLRATDYLYYNDSNVNRSDSDLEGESSPYLEQLETERVKRLCYLSNQKKSSVGKEYRRLKQRKRSPIYWYSLFTENYQLKQLCKYVNLSDFYRQFYPFLSLGVHGVTLFPPLNGSRKKEMREDTQPDIQQVLSLYYLQWFMEQLEEQLVDYMDHSVD